MYLYFPEVEKAIGIKDGKFYVITQQDMENGDYLLYNKWSLKIKSTTYDTYHILYDNIPFDVTKNKIYWYDNQNNTVSYYSNQRSEIQKILNIKPKNKTYNLLFQIEQQRVMANDINLPCHPDYCFTDVEFVDSIDFNYFGCLK
jgi:hypothetical protein